MIFYVTIPLLFGLFANYLIPFHVQTKDVAYPRLNVVGLWILPAGFLLMGKPAFMRRQVYRHWDPYDAYKDTSNRIVDNFSEVMGDYNQITTYRYSTIQDKHKFMEYNSYINYIKKSTN